MEENGYESIRQMQGSMSMRSVGDPAAFERANYMKVLRSYSLRRRPVTPLPLGATRHDHSRLPAH